MDRLPRSRSFLVALSLVGAGLAAIAQPVAHAGPTTDDRSGSAPITSPAGQVIEGEYIVVMKPRAEISATQEVRRTALRSGGEILFDYSAALDGFAARLPAQALEAVENDPNVAYVEANRTVTAFGEDQYDSPWGLDRIDQRGRSLNRTYHYDQTGAGVKAYVIDSGIRITHAQFGNRASHGFDAIDGLPADDCNGHGTHVAGTIGGKDYGVAKRVKLVAVRVLGCDGKGSFAGVISGIDFVTGAHAAGAPAVANLSLGGGFSAAVNTAVDNLIADGVTVVVAAGNDTIDACNVSPASTAGALTVGATTYEDRRAPYSNWGTCLDLFAPGSQVLSAYHGQRHGQPHRQRHLPGDPARGRRGGDLPAGERGRDPGRGRDRGARGRHRRQGHRPRRGHRTSSCSPGSVPPARPRRLPHRRTWSPSPGSSPGSAPGRARSGPSTAATAPRYPGPARATPGWVGTAAMSPSFSASPGSTSRPPRPQVLRFYVKVQTDGAAPRAPTS